VLQALPLLLPRHQPCLLFTALSLTPTSPVPAVAPTLLYPLPYPVLPLCSRLPSLCSAPSAAPSLCPPSQVCRTLQEKGASTVPLSAMDVAQVLDSLVYEGWLDYEGAGAWQTDAACEGWLCVRGVAVCTRARLRRQTRLAGHPSCWRDVTGGVRNRRLVGTARRANERLDGHREQLREDGARSQPSSVCPRP